MIQKPTIRILNEYTAKQIAAGEVIERPACVVRELIDNSIDSSAQNIEVQLKNGGLESICISDDGIGMSQEDIALCCHAHATSKIQNVDDLLALTSMGFRGEALASISAISKTTITSFDSTKNCAYEITVANNVASQIRHGVRNKGTRVCVEELFQAIPVRKKFLSSISAERMRVKNTIVEKSAAFPEVSFVLKEGNETILRIPCEDAFMRAIRITTQGDSRMFVWKDNTLEKNKLPPEKSEIKNENPNNTLKIHAALGLPEIATKTRKHIHTYINKRPVRSFQLVQAVEYAYRAIIHGNVFPQVVIFLHIDPSEIDVNIHPSKQEVRIKPITQVRSLIIRTIEAALETYISAVPHYNPSKNDAIKTDVSQNIFTSEKSVTPSPRITQKNIPIKHSLSTYRYTAPNSLSTTRNIQTIQKMDRTPIQAICENKTTEYYAEAQRQNDAILFIGCAFATYAVFEVGAKLLFLDFHATHEKRIFDSLTENPQPQALVLPVPLHLPIPEADIPEAIETYKHIGIIIKQETKNAEVSYLLSQVPQALYKNIGSITSLIESTHYTSRDLNVELFARKACRSAGKAGDHLDASNAYDLLAYARSLKTPRCPHGRPLWTCILKLSLDRMVGRIQ